MKITIVTDHRFFRFGEEVYDDYVFNYKFFETYLRIFDEVDVVARIKNVPEIDSRWQLASGLKLNFIDIPDTHGLKWLLFSKRFFKAKKEVIFNTDCLCFRLPSHASWEVFQLNDVNLPYIFESIGDPQDSMVSSNQSFFKQVLYSALGYLLRDRKRKIVTSARAGSYVSTAHLQKKFPVAHNIYTESISSIRLDSAYVIDKKLFAINKSVALIHVGSFIPLKNQKDLIHSVKKLIDLGHDVSLHLVGEGRLKDLCITLANELGISDKIIFHGQVTGFQNIVDLLDQSQIFILPSSNEGMPRSLIEAMARGLVCFGSNAGGIAELLPKEFIFPAGDVNEITTKISDFINNITEQNYQAVSQRNIGIAKQFELEKLEYKRSNLLKFFREAIKNERNKKSI